MSLVLAVAVPKVVEAVPGPYVLAMPYSFLGWLGLYTATTLTYSLYLKRKLLLDVFVLSGLYTVRILAGSARDGGGGVGVAGRVQRVLFSVAGVCRALQRARRPARARRHGDQWTRLFCERSGAAARAWKRSGVCGGGRADAVYQRCEDDSAVRTHQPVVAGGGVLLLWLSHVWMLSSRGEMHDDPVVFALTDRRSLWIGVLMAVVTLVGAVRGRAIWTLCVRVKMDF